MSSTQNKVLRRGEEPVPSLLNHFRGHKGSILSVAFHPNTQTLFSASQDGFIMNWNFKKETRALRFEGHCGPVNEVNLSKDGDLMISASDDKTVRIWVPIINGRFQEIRRHSAPVRSACFSPVDTAKFVTASNDKTVRLWSIESKRMKSGNVRLDPYNFISSFNSHTNWVRSARFSPDGHLIVSASDDKTIQIFDTRSGKCISKFTSNVGSPIKAEFNPCGNTYVGVCTTEQAFLMYDIRQPKLLQSYLGLSACGAVNSFAFHPTGDFAVCVGEDAKIKILDLIEGRPIFTLLGPRTALYATAFNSSGSLFATGGKDKELLVWEPTLIPYLQENEESKKTQARGTDSNKENSDESYLNTERSGKESLENLSRTSSSARNTPSQLSQ